MITVKNLHKSFDKINVLNGIDEHIEKGEKVVVIGPSGSGKSTFLRCLNLLETPTDGEIFIDGELINAPKVDVNRIREKMGMVFQQFNLFPHLTILDNITLAPIKVKKMAKEAAEKREKVRAAANDEMDKITDKAEAECKVIKAKAASERKVIRDELNAKLKIMYKEEEAEVAKLNGELLKDNIELTGAAFGAVNAIVSQPFKRK